MQLLHAISKSRKNDLSDVQENIDNLVIQDHHIIRKHHVFLRLSSKQFIILLLLKKKNNLHLDWKKIYLLVHIVTKDNNLCAFQFKLLNDVLYLNKMLFKFGKSGALLCSFCNLKNGTPYHLFYERSQTNSFWNQLRHVLSNSLNIPLLTPQVPFLVLSTTKKTF